MKKDINTIYNEFIPDINTKCTKKEEVKLYIIDCIRYLKDNKKNLKKDIKKNNALKKVSILVNMIPYLDFTYPSSFFDEDNEILDNSIKTIEKYEEYIYRLFEVLDDNNFKEIFKLLSFICISEGEYADKINYLREKLEYNYKGINYHNPNIESSVDIEELDTLINNKCKTKTL